MRNRRIVGGNSLLDLIKYEFAISFVGKIPGAIGILLRKHLYKRVLKRMGKGVVIAGGVLIRHPRSIYVEVNTLIDEYCILDSKTASEKGMYIGKNCIIGYRTFITTGFDGYVAIGDNVHVDGPDTCASVNSLCKLCNYGKEYVNKGFGYYYKRGCIVKFRE